MQRHLVLAAALALSAPPAAAQIRIPPVRLIAGVGETGASNYALYQNTAGLYLFSHGPAATAQVGLETPSGIRGVDLRLGLQYSKPMMWIEPLPFAATLFEPPHEVYRTSVKKITLDAAIHLPRVLDSSPYLLAGAGVVRYDFNETYYHDSNQPVTPQDRTRATLHLGAGTAWNVGRYDLFVEGSTYLTHHPDYSIEGNHVGTGNNMVLTAGIRVPIHR